VSERRHRAQRTNLRKIRRCQYGDGCVGCSAARQFRYTPPKEEAEAGWGGNGDALTGNVTSLRALKDTLEKVRIWSCPNLVGNFMDLADFPRLKRLNFDGTAVTGDIRDIREHDYSVFERRPWPPKDCRWW